METILGLVVPPNISSASLRPRGLEIRGRRETDSAAQFWGALCCELSNLTPTADSAELIVTDEHSLDAAALDPLHSLKSDLERFREGEARTELSRALAEIALYGLPPRVWLRALRGAEPILERELPRGLFDAELFRHFLCCLLAWAEVPEVLWNVEIAGGEFMAACLPTGPVFHVAVELRNTPLSEGLVLRRVRISAASV
ncbi:MAG: hypothetical protein GXP31_05045 [Kiritimatiellaeota bacterium]|nr:hypothetical protein [Kiritimatiellota bacterium]